MTTTTENFGWVIEGAWSHVTKPDYWQGSSAWGQDPDLALRFARKPDLTNGEMRRRIVEFFGPEVDAALQARFDGTGPDASPVR